MSSLKRLISEIHHRSLWQVLLIYVGAGWVVFEVVQTVTEGLGLPQWFPAFAALLLLIGLPVVLATAFVREGEPAAIVSDPTLLPVDEARTEAVRKQQLLTWRNAGLSFLVALAVWGLVATGWLLFGERATPEEVDARKSIAVLPLENLSREEATEPFTDGIHDDILTHLYKIGDLKVISRTSVLEYRDTRKNLRQIADELGVATILEGGVQRSGNRVRINVQLIDAETDEHLWAETYEQDLTAENIFAIQTDIAQRIALALKAHLTPGESERIAARPTEDLEAYDYYLRGEDYSRRAPLGVQAEEYALRDSAAAMYKRAVELDSGFAVAWAALAGQRFKRFGRGLKPEDREEGKKALDRAVALAPESFETNMAQSAYYRAVERDPVLAMRHLGVAETLRPNDAQVLVALARVLNSQGKLEEGLGYFERAQELDPLNATAANSLGAVSLRLRRYSAAEQHLDRAITLDPSASEPYSRKFELYLWGLGDTVQARVYAKRHPERSNRWYAELDYVRRNFERALEGYSGFDPGNWQTIGKLYHAMNQSGRLRAYGDSLVREWKTTWMAQIGEGAHSLEISWAHSYLGLWQAFAGDIEEAIREGEEALEVYPLATDQGNYWIIVNNLCAIYLLAGKYDAAVDQLGVLLSRPNPITAARLKLDPFYDPLRDHPRFQALLEEYE